MWFVCFPFGPAPAAILRFVPLLWPPHWKLGPCGAMCIRTPSHSTVSWDSFYQCLVIRCGLLITPAHLSLCPVHSALSLPTSGPPYSPFPLTPGHPTAWDQGILFSFAVKTDFCHWHFLRKFIFLSYYNFHSSQECQNLCNGKSMHILEGPTDGKCVKRGICLQHLSTSPRTNVL